MVNVKGGKAYKKHKKTNSDEVSQYRKKETDQFVGNITKLLGNLNANVYCEDNKTRICKIADGIRKRIRFGVGDIVLISLRDCLVSKSDLEKGIHSDRGDIIDKYPPEHYDRLLSDGANPHLFRHVDVLNSMSEKIEKGDMKAAEAIANASNANYNDFFEFSDEKEPDNEYVTKPKVDWKTDRALGITKEAAQSADDLAPQPAASGGSAAKKEEGDSDVDLDDL